MVRLYRKENFHARWRDGIKREKASVYPLKLDVCLLLFFFRCESSRRGVGGNLVFFFLYVLVERVE